MLRDMIADLSAPQLPARWQRAAQVLWILVTLLALAFFIYEVNLSYSELLDAPLNLQKNLADHGISLRVYANYLTGLRSIYMLVHLVIAGIIIFKRPNERIAVFTAFFLVMLGTTFWPLAERVADQPDFWRLPRAIANLLMSSSLLIFFLIFPDGRFTPRWTKPVAVVMLGLLVIENFFPESKLNPQNNWTVGATLSLITMVIMVYVPVHRYRSMSNPVLRQQTKWVVYGISAAIIGFFIVTLPASFGISMEEGTTYGLISITGMMLSILFIPISIGIAITRSRLWDIDPIINRTLVYGALSFLTILFYVLTVGVFALYFRSNETNLVISFIATGVVAILFEPLRQRLQRAVNRLMYGERDDPATVLIRLSQRLDSALAPDSVLQTIVETLAQTLRLPYAAISLLDEEPRFASTRQLPPSELIHLPLTYQTERVGELILAPRAAGESFSTADMKLINIIAQQAGVAAYTVRLNNDLQKSRERLVTAQEEERRRLRRDLHDGVGPTLASLSQRIDTASEFVKSDPEKSVQLLKELKGQVKETVSEIRRLVYALRPPVLDEFGLVSAIREYVAQYSGPNGMTITFDVTEPLPSLPAAVEVAAYRIALESFTNIIKHAEASACQIKIKIENRSLLLEISDNGKGLSAESRAGVGRTSMHERAAELGGECVIENIPTGGTRVSARLPIGKE
ncbi:sensor histidine kinase [Candidatus Villigracilis affinis]|uniref:sensor histidine kinase n=1 Tax=Candidatus Villigracilis affinis TaxID=3140682 RepID=UPI001DD7551C|nr:sensor histidine kinase [Anaerolineales bacterium]